MCREGAVSRPLARGTDGRASGKTCFSNIFGQSGLGARPGSRPVRGQFAYFVRKTCSKSWSDLIARSREAERAMPGGLLRLNGIDQIESVLRVPSWQPMQVS